MAKHGQNGQNGQNGLKWSKPVRIVPKWSNMVKTGQNGQKWPKLV